MAGLRERKRRQTFKVIHEAAMELFARHGYAAVTVEQIARAAEVSRATIYAYYPNKEDIVVGDAPMAIERLRAALDARETSVLEAVRVWLQSLVGWMAPDIVLQRRIADEVPAVASARSRLLRDIAAVIAEGLAAEMPDAPPLVPALVAGALTSSLVAAEDEAVRRVAETGEALDLQEVDALLRPAIAFIEAGMAAFAPN